MKKLYAVIKKEYKVIVKKKSFIIMTVLTPVLMAGMMFVPVMLMKMGRTDKKIAVADYAGDYYQALSAKPQEKKRRKRAVSTWTPWINTRTRKRPAASPSCRWTPPGATPRPWCGTSSRRS